MIYCFCLFQNKMWKNIKKSFILKMPLKRAKVHVFKKKKDVSRVATFQDSMKIMLRVGQVFGLVSVSGLWYDDGNNIRFKWRSWKCLYTLVLFCGQVFLTIMCVMRLLRSKTSLESATPIIFYGTTCITIVMFFQIARKWPRLSKNVANAELKDPNFDTSVVKKCNVACAVVFILSLTEHILSLLSAIAGAKNCNVDYQGYESFVSHFYPWVFNFLPYSAFYGIVTQFLHVQSTFVWNYSDLFVVCTSYYLTSRLDQVNKKLKVSQGKYLPETFWRSIRGDYCRATDVVRQVDDVISGVVFISFANNLFFVCLQLFHTLEDGIKGTSQCPDKNTTSTTLLKGYEQATYFIFSLVFLISRSIAVSLIASQVHSASLVPAPVLYEVPSPVFCTEVQRFIEQVNTDNVALTGLQFFSVTKGLLLSMAGTIITYELVMVQFSTPSPTPAPTTSTTTAATTLNATNTY